MSDSADRLKVINRRIDALAQEYEQTPPHDPRRVEIADEISALRLELGKLDHKRNRR
ncbi:MAG TPA: hypothetical protein VJQ55_17215 [Candidatus Binatia bacterium]|nr:hypothetical protein [Candidatus Binatia bacterium]